MPRRRSREMPMISAKLNRLVSSTVPVDQSRVPSVRTPSTSKAMACRLCRPSVSCVGVNGIRLDSSADAAQLLHHRDLFLVDALYAIAHGLLAKPDITNEAADAVGLEGGSLVGAPHGAVHRDVALHAAGAEHSGGHGGGDAGLVAGVADGQVIALNHGGDGAQVELFVLRR